MRQAKFGSPSQYNVLLDDLVCSGEEGSLLDCPRSYRSGDMLVEREVGDSDCSHQEDAGVRCDGEYLSRYHTRVSERDRVCVFVCVCERERECVCVCVCVCVCLCVCESVCV